ncbi:helix-hairpin-helix domain-containing protein [Candidatus Leptofilum sp.]|uniref:helix-hairpin-helix domain-containing protein n=1 Tax=Candidatus Leptofilum sp. TaxID=3241576 RepID=UPI003B5AF957
MNQKSSPATPDDFRQIKGIGPATEQRLHAAEIHTYAQLTAVSPQALAELLPGFTAERIQQEDWLGQAEALLSAKSGDDGQRYATFTVELLLDEDNSVRRTRVVHVQEESKKSWSGWRPKAVKQFIAAQAGLAAQPKAKAVTATDAAEQTAVPTQTVTSIDELTMQFVSPVDDDQPETAVAPSPEADTPLQTGVAAQPLSVELNTPNILLEHGHAFNVQLYLDLETISLEKQTPLNYQAAIYAAQLGGTARHKVGTAYGAINTNAKKVAITVPTQIGAPGTYRLEAEMAIAWIPSTPDITANTKGGLLHIY